MTNKRSIEWLKLELEKGVSWDDTSESTKNIREQAEVEIKEAFYMAIKALEQQPCEDAVSRQAVDELSKQLVHTTRDKADFLCNFWEGLQKLPSVAPKEKTGKWIDITNKNGTVIAVRCNCCENSPKHAIRSDFCPNCGARMVSE